jgi:hypothetical protein
MMFMSIYYSMLLSNWNVMDSTSEQTVILSHSIISFWVKSSVIFLTGLTYVWILIAPRLFPDREFDF